jgi:hypothetical protein
MTMIPSYNLSVAQQFKGSTLRLDITLLTETGGSDILVPLSCVGRLCLLLSDFPGIHIKERSPE